MSMQLRFNLVLCSVLLFSAISGRAQTVIAGWDFENYSGYTQGHTADFGAADLGASRSGTDASGNHAFAATTYQATTGNGGGTAVSADNWATLDYFQFSASTAGYSNISVSFDQAGVGGSISSAPKNFTLYYSTNGSTYTAGPAYTISASWQTFTFDLSAISALSNDATASFRLEQSGSLTIGGKKGVSALAMVAVDNFSVSGLSAVPEPATYSSIFGGAALVAAVWRRRRQISAS
jgi:hypothetical protein